MLAEVTFLLLLISNEHFLGSIINELSKDVTCPWYNFLIRTCVNISK